MVSANKKKSRKNYARLKAPFRQANIGRKSLPYIGPSV